MAAKDVELVIKARNEGGKAIKSFTAALENLVDVQKDVTGSAGRTQTVLAALGNEITSLNQEVRDLSAFGRVVADLDRAAAAVQRLEDRVAKATAEQQRLSAAQAEAGKATAAAKAGAQAAADAYEQQAAKSAAVRSESGKTSDAYKAEAAALDSARAARTAANGALREAERQESALGKQLATVSQTLENQRAALSGAEAEWRDLYTAAQTAGKGLGDLAATQDDVAAAAGRAAEKLSLAKGAADFTREAAGAQRLREAAKYVAFWTQALNEKDAAESRARSQRVAEQLADQNRELKAAADYMDAYQARLNAVVGVQEKASKSAKESFEAFASAGRSEDQMASAAARLRAQLDPLAEIQAAHNREVARAKELYQAGYITAAELAEAERRLALETDKATKAFTRANGTGAGGGDGGSLFGLRPYELHSLSYQVNDVITQLGSGTPVMQVFAQQGGQVFQVFQRQLIPALAKAGPIIGALSPAIAGFAAGAGLLVNVTKNVNDMTDSFRQFSGELAASADGAAYNARAMAEAAHQLDVYGGKLQDARKALSIFAKEGLNPDYMIDFGKAAQDMADVTGEDVPSAAAKLAEAFSGGYEQIAKLDDSMNFLTAAEREQIKAMFESGRASDARQLAFGRFAKSMNDGARAMRGPWASAMKNLTGAWDNFLTAIENSSAIQGALRALEKLAEGAKKVSEQLPGVEERSATGVGLGGAETLAVERELTDLREARAAAAEREARIAQKGGRSLLTGDKPNNLAVTKTVADQSVAQIDAQIRAKEQQLLALKKAAADTLNAESEARSKVQNDVLSALDKERQALGDISDQRKVQIAGEAAYRQAILETGDAVIAQARQRLAIEKEIERQRLAVNYGALAGKIGGIESSGDANAKNPNSTATGLGQFIEKTWIKLFKKHFPAEAAGKSEQAILDLRRNADLSKKMIEIYARENAAVLQKAGLAVNEASLYLAHFLGPNGAMKVLRAGTNAPVEGLLGADQVAANKSVLKGKTAGQVVSWAQGKVGASDDQRGLLTAQAEAAEALRKSAEERKKAQDDFNDAIADENVKRQRAADIQGQTNILMGEARLLKEREIAIQEAVRLADEKAAEASEGELRAGREKIELTAKQRAEIERTAAAEWDAANKSAQLAAQVQKQDTDMNALLEQRRLLIEQIGLAQQGGDAAAADALLVQFDSVNLKIQEAGASAVAFWQALAGDPARLAMLGLTAQQVQNIVMALQGAVAQTKNFNTQFIATGQQINQMIAGGAVNAFDQFAQSVAEGEDAFQAAGDAFRAFAADFLRQIAAMILQQAILNALGGGAAGGGVGGSISSFLSGLFHDGGVVGQGGKNRYASPAWFANAPRYHTGGIVGLKPGEIPAILKKNEEVLTEDSPRNILNGGASAGGSPEVNVKVINAVDPGDLVSQGLNTAAGERAVINLIRANPSAVQAALGGRG